MKNLLITIDYRDSTNKFWANSQLKNTIVSWDDEKQTIHQLISTVIKEEDYQEMSYRGKPQTNIYVDQKNGKSKCVGYVYRTKSNIDNKQAFFDAWVSIYEVIDFPIEDVEK